MHERHKPGLILVVIAICIGISGIIMLQFRLFELVAILNGLGLFLAVIGYDLALRSDGVLGKLFEITEREDISQSNRERK